MELPTKMLVLLLVAFGVPFPHWLAAPPITLTERLEVSQQHPTAATYMSFMMSLDCAVKSTTVESILYRPLLGEQKLSTTPEYWVNIELTDAAGRRLLTLALRSDNLYVSGFANRHGEWFAFKGQQAKLPGSTALSYTGDYADIFGKGVAYRGLGSVQVNRAQALANTLLLADYRSGSGPDTALKPALGFFILTISEAERFPTLRAALGRAMDASTPQTMGESLVRLAVNWKRLSCALRAWDRFGRTMAVWNANTEARELRTNIGVTTPEAALDNIQPLLRSNGCTWTH